MIKTVPPKTVEETLTAALSGFLAGIRWGLECIQFDVDDMIETKED